MTIYGVKPSDAGLYFCVSNTNAGLTPGFLHLNVMRRDEAILQNPKNMSVELGGTANFTCQSYGKLAPWESTALCRLKEVWMDSRLTPSTQCPRNKKQETKISWVKLEENDDFVVVGEGSNILEIENATYAHEGTGCLTNF